jgi:hypothetical protein
VGRSVQRWAMAQAGVSAWGWKSLEWDSPASTDTLTLRDTSFVHSILLEVGGAHVAER